ncbi:hypothetical protein C8A01DRAFT_39431 [Parachaetomium inaequale]|uniref:Uncharacterized protein n=1 Tax=Parachaetomium inaequale TaxID=2588326 RepID=A0AAN6SNY0_9PEZI|nr:hypothetical protein C8A01DRAFT_39431 [Parachaetomium inaequale]
MAPTTAPKAQQGHDASRNGNTEPPSHEPPAPSPSSSSVGDNLAQALRDLARGEQTASTLEANLTSLESKLDEILASFGVSAEDLDALDEQEEKKKKTRKDGKDGEGKGAAAAAASEASEGKKGGGGA